MTNAFAAIQNAIVAALLVKPAMADGSVMRNRTRPLGAGVSEAVVVYLESSRATETVLGASDWTSLFTVECYAKSVPTSSADADVHALLASVYARLCALEFDGLGVMHSAVNPAIAWQYQEDAAATVCASLQFVVLHRTFANSLAPYP